MFTERELLILSYAVDVVNNGGNFFTRQEGRLLCHKIHNMLRAQRQINAEAHKEERE